MYCSPPNLETWLRAYTEVHVYNNLFLSHLLVMLK